MSEIPRDNSVSYECKTCNDEQIYGDKNDPLPFWKHLEEKHQFPPHTKGVGLMALHLDTATHAITTYDCKMTHDGKTVEFFQTRKVERESAYRLRKLKVK